MADNSESKTEKATPKKKQDARKKGNVFKSQDVPAACSILAMFIMLRMMIPMIYDQIRGLMNRYISLSGQLDVMTPALAMSIFQELLMAFAICVGPLALCSIVVNVIATGVQTRFLISRENIKLKFSRLSPLQGIKRMFSLRAVVELMKSLIKVVIIASVLFSSVQGILNSFTRMVFMDLKYSLPELFGAIMDMVISLSIAFIVIAGADFLYQWWDYQKNLRMTKQEIKEEYKHMEGDPQVKARIREIQRKMATGRMMQQVPQADVVVKNPTHFAVALRYDIDKDHAPIVLAKGKDNIAFRIIEIAEKNGVPVTENRPLARLLYDTADIGREVPPEAYAALAEVIAWVYSLRNDQ